jgi:hypothetical protein
MGEGTEAKLVEELRLADAEKKISVMNLFDNANKIKGLTDQETLSGFIDLELTKAQYLYLRNVTDERNCPLFPPYYKIQEMKKRCYPPASSIEITNTYAKILKISRESVKTCLARGKRTRCRARVCRGPSRALSVFVDAQRRLSTFAALTQDGSFASSICVSCAS